MVVGNRGNFLILLVLFIVVIADAVTMAWFTDSISVGISAIITFCLGFVVAIYLSRIDKNSDQLFSSYDETQMPTSTLGANHRVLVIDSDAQDLKSLVDLLLQHSFKVDGVPSAEQAMKHLEHYGKPDLVLLEAKSKGLNGYMLCQAIRKRYSADELPIVMLVNKGKADDIVEIFAVGANDYLTKPVSSDELVLRLEGQLEINHSITAHLQETNELILAQDHLKSVLNAMPSILIGIDDNETVTNWNFEAEKITNLKSSNAIGKKLFEVFPSLQTYAASIRETLNQNAMQPAIKMEYEWNGETHYFELTVYPLTEENDKGAVIRLDDITSRIKLEDMMSQTEKMMSLGGLAEGMAHEINNPIAGIMFSIQNLERRLDPGLSGNIQAAASFGIDLTKLKGYLKQRGVYNLIKDIQEAGDRAGHIVHEMIGFTKNVDADREEVNLNEILQDIYHLLKNDKDLQNSFEVFPEVVEILASDLPVLMGKPNELHQVFFNCLKNAYHAVSITQSLRKPFVKFTVRHVRGFIEFSIEDNGPGMRDEIRRRVFEPFYTTESSGALGLGLSVAYYIVLNSYDGSMQIDTQLDKGTSILISIPVKQFAADKIEAN